MCDTCGCSLNSETSIASLPETKLDVANLAVRLLHANDHEAEHNREHFDRHGVLAVNLMSSPGSGKTSLLEATIEALSPTVRIAVIEGDLETENDAERIRKKGVPAIQICTGTACHLDASMVHHALHEIDLEAIDLLFIENVGNLVCPASFDLGHHASAILLSVTEGDDKPAKYPVMFRDADLVLISKCDLKEAVGDFETERATQAIRDLANPAPIAEISARTQRGIEPWLEWLRAALDNKRAAA